MNGLNWTPLLLTDPSPSLRYLVLTELLNKPLNDKEVQSLSKLTLHDPLVQPLLTQQDIEGSWTPGILYNSDHRSTFQVTCDVLKRLGYLGFNSSNEIVSNAAEYLYRLQNDDGSWTGPVSAQDGYYQDSSDYIPLNTALPLRALAGCGYAEDPRSLQAYNWLLEKQLPDGAWSTGKAGGGVIRYRAGYRKLPLSKFGCRSNTTGVVSCLAFHPKLRKSDECKRGIEHLLSCQTQDRQTLGFEISRIIGFEGTTGTLTYYAKLDHLLTLDLCWRVGVSKDDSQLQNILKLIKNSINQFGLLKYIPNSNATRWITFDYKRSLNRLKIEDEWESHDFKVPFQRYTKINKRF